MMIPLAAAAAVLLATPAWQVAHADALTFGAPQKLVTLDKIKGEPTQMAWSPDGSELYVQTGERTRIGTFQNTRHYVVTIAGPKLKSADAAPSWATDYYAWKSNKWAPGVRTFAINISDEKRTQRAVSAPMGGDLAKGGGNPSAPGASSDDMVSAALTSQTQHVITLTLNGEVVGEYVDLQFVPGYTFGWAPQAVGTLIAYANRDGRLAVMDQKGAKTQVPDTKNVLLPGWAEDGTKIAFLQKNGKKFELYVTDVK